MLLAKSLQRTPKQSKRTPFSATLFGHLQQCLDVADVFNEFAVEGMVHACGLSDRRYVEWFRRGLRVAAILHDIGKSTDRFQARVQGQQTFLPPDLVRHEAVSYWIMSKHSGVNRAVRHLLDNEEWPRSQALLPLLVVAVLGHHLKFPRSPRQKDGGRFLEEPQSVLLRELREEGVFQLIESVTGTTVLDASVPEIEGGFVWLDEEVQKPCRTRMRSLELSDVEQNFGAMLRAALIAVDTVGSIHCETRQEWEERTALLRGNFESGRRVTEVIRQMIESKLSPKNHHPLIDGFQQRVAESDGDIVVVEAGCGLGKTIAAYQRIIRQSGLGLFMTFPTTSVTSQMYEEYTADQKGMTQLLHSRSVVDLELQLHTSPQDVEPGEPDLVTEVKAVEEALRRLLSPVTFCTVDTVLGVLQLRRASLCLLPNICQSHVVFDEVHIYDDRLYRHLLSFLRTFRVPAIVMTATLPPGRRQEFIGALSERNVAFVSGPDELEQVPRYIVEAANDMTSRDIPVDVIKEAIAEGKRVLVVVNQVDAAVDVFRRLRAEPELANFVHIFHSRFKYDHRRQRQDEVVRLFGQPHPACLVTTQICEISFDISADVLVSHIAPFTSIVQRLGRLNRGAFKTSGSGFAIFFRPKAILPYGESELQTGYDFLTHVRQQYGGQPFSQAVLRDWLKQSEAGFIDPASDQEQTWFRLDKSRPGSNLRESGVTVEAILQSDFSRSETSVDKLKWSLPLLAKPNMLQRSQRWRHCFIVDDDLVDYSPLVGGRWNHE